MPKKLIATSNAVTSAVEQLVTEGLDPTLERVRAKLGGGSYTTISRVLAAKVDLEKKGGDKVGDIPGELIEIGRKAVAAIYTSLQRQAAATLEVVEADARRRIDLTQTARAEAVLEIERLERELEMHIEQLEVAATTAQRECDRSDRIEARSEAQQIEISRLSIELSTVRAELDAARQQARDVQAEARRATDELQLRNQTLQIALTKAETLLESTQNC